MVLDKLGSSLKATLAKIAQSVFVDEKLINELIKDIQRALLQADVNVKLVFSLSQKIKDRALKEKTPSGLTKKEYLVNIVYEELVLFLGGERPKLEITKTPFTIMLVGLFGSGKTTTAGKLGAYLGKRGYKVALVGLDVHRPAAMDQLEQVAKRAGVTAFTTKTEKDPVKIWTEIEPKLKKYDIIIVDTAGRDALSKDLIEEITTIAKLIDANQRYLVISSDIGQTAQTQADEFHKSCNITGVIATKMDGTAKAGGALTACAATDAPIVFIGIGENTGDIEAFRAKGFVGRLLGMGDLEALLEKAKGAISEEDAEDLGKRMLKGDFNLLDLYEQMSAMKKMGPLKKVVEMIPGFGSIKLPKEFLEGQQGKLDNWKIAMSSMTQEELEKPDILSASQIARISSGSGIPIKDIRELVKQYRQSKKLMKQMKGGKNMEKMMQRMGQMPQIKFK